MFEFGARPSFPGPISKLELESSSSPITLPFFLKKKEITFSLFFLSIDDSKFSNQLL